MRAGFFALLLLTGCGPHPAIVPLALAEGASVVVFGRGIGDIGVSAISGRDCSIVRLDRGLTYCAPRDVPLRTAYCTRTLAAVDCWEKPTLLPTPRPNVADTPDPTSAQLRYRDARWPKALFAEPP